MNEEPLRHGGGPAPISSGKQAQQTPSNHVNYEAYDEQVALQTMQENLRRHRQQSQTPQPQKPPATSFNGPFFRLEQVSPSPPGRQFSSEQTTHHHYRQQRNQEQSPAYQVPNTLSRQESPPSYDYRPNYGAPGETVVIWPPPASSQDRSRPTSVTPKSIVDPERIGVFERQKQQELEAMRKREEKELRSLEKQYYATQLQQQRIQSRMSSEAPRNEHLDYQQRASELASPAFTTNLPSITGQTLINRQSSYPGSDPGPTPNFRVYEARPISALSDGSALAPSWKQTYLVDEQQEIAARNEILTSNEVLERDRFDVDLLQRREAFIEKTEPEPAIHRTGRRWQPPPEKPYIWPYTVGDEGVEHKWQPMVENPDYKYERKNFTPTHSPPQSPIKGRGTRPLDEVAQRQTKNVIQPSPDGSHRPKPAFKVSRAAPSGGFIPHAPNAVKLVKKRGVDTGSSLGSINQQEEDLQMVHETTYHLVNDPTPRKHNSNAGNLNSTIFADQ